MAHPGHAAGAAASAGRDDACTTGRAARDTGASASATAGRTAHAVIDRHAATGRARTASGTCTPAPAGAGPDADAHAAHAAAQCSAQPGGCANATHAHAHAWRCADRSECGRAGLAQHDDAEPAESVACGPAAHAAGRHAPDSPRPAQRVSARA